MSTIYVVEQGAVLKKESKRLVIEKDGNILLEIPDFKIERILLFGNIQITTQAMKFLLESGIETSFFTIHGKLLGRLSPIESKNVILRMCQYERYKDEEFKLLLAKTIVEGKIKNAIVVIQKFARNHPEMDFNNSLKSLGCCLDELPRKTQVSSTVGVEGRASAIYFEAFGKMFRKELRFTTRSRQPPLDPVNSLLSLGYTLITNEMFSVTSAIGFDPYIGYLHEINYGRPSLALDIIEEFRHTIVDRLTLELVNKEILSLEDFEEKEGGIYLKDEPRKKYFLHYEKRMQENFQDVEFGEKVTYRRFFQLQAQRFSKTIQEKVAYKPFAIK